MNILLLIAAGATIAGLLAYILRLHRQLFALRIDYESEQAWSDEYSRQAQAAEAEAAALRQQLAITQHWHARSMEPVLGAAWRAGLGKTRQ